jgi:hypothetical protein
VEQIYFPMTLQEFVRDSLLQISNGVVEAKKKNKNIGLEVTALGKQEASCTTVDKRAGFLVDFDVAVTVSERTGKEMGAGILVASLLNAGGKKSAGSEQSSVSRIRFCVPIIFS